MTNIRTRLQQDYDHDRLYGAYIIASGDPNSALDEVQSFIAESMLNSEPPVSEAFTHPDYMLVQKEDKLAKNIAVKQIRDLQEFAYKTSIISGHKIGVILNADLMNVNAANSALKMLEDVPSHCTFFLISSNAASLLPTIKSRCALLEDKVKSSEKEIDKELQNKLIETLKRDCKPDTLLGFIQEFASKDRTRWREMANYALELFARLIKFSHGIMSDITEQERKLMQQYEGKHPFELQQAYEEICEHINRTIEYDLDLRASTLLLIEKMKQH